MDEHEGGGETRGAEEKGRERGMRIDALALADNIAK